MKKRVKTIYINNYYGQKPIALCARTGTYVYPTTTKGYYGYCKYLDEDLYTFETMELRKLKV